MRQSTLNDYSVEITGTNEKAVYALSKNHVISVTGLEGKVVIQIQDQKVRVVSSSCLNKICVKQGWISLPGPMIICAPNRVMVRIVQKRIRPLVTY